MISEAGRGKPRCRCCVLTEGILQPFGCLADIGHGQLQDLLAEMQTLFVCKSREFSEHDGVATSWRARWRILELGDDGSFELVFRPFGNGIVQRGDDVHGRSRTWVSRGADVPQFFEGEVTAGCAVCSTLDANLLPYGAIAEKLCINAKCCTIGR